jgi:hypothetical protein
MKTLELFRSNSSARTLPRSLQLIKHGVLGVCALLSIAALISSFKPKPLVVAPGCTQPVYNFNNHCNENLKANLQYYNCAGALHTITGIDVPAGTLTAYTVPGDSEHIHLVQLYCPATNVTMATTITGTCSQAGFNVACNGSGYCLTFQYMGAPWCLDGGAINISYGPC